MTGWTLQLSTDEVLRALVSIDLADLVPGPPAGPACDDLTPWSGHDEAPGLVLLRDAVAGDCLLPVVALEQAGQAVVTALAARRLVNPGVVTAAIVGPAAATWLPLTLVARSLPGLSHVAVCPIGSPVLDPRVADLLDLAGIGRSVCDVAAAATFGATLVIVAAAEPDRLAVDRLVRGAVVVNCAGDAALGVLAGVVDRVCADDVASLPERARRRLAGADGAFVELTDVLSGRKPGRVRRDDVLLVHVLRATTRPAPLARAIHRAALQRGLGVRMAR